MKAISIKQPWAWAILHAGKNVENRTWKTNYRGPVLIHTGKKFDREGAEWLVSNRDRLGIEMVPDSPKFLPMGGIVGRISITNMVMAYDSPWMFGPWGWVLTNPIPLDFHPCPGQLGLFDTPLDVIRTDKEGRDVTITPGLWSESDRYQLTGL